jgi:hypothetical protein
LGNQGSFVLEIGVDAFRRGKRAKNDRVADRQGIAEQACHPRAAAPMPNENPWGALRKRTSRSGCASVAPARGVRPTYPQISRGNDALVTMWILEK